MGYDQGSLAGSSGVASVKEPPALGWGACAASEACDRNSAGIGKIGLGRMGRP